MHKIMIVIVEYMASGSRSLLAMVGKTPGKASNSKMNNEKTPEHPRCLYS